jgi:hypothetical protein
VLVFSGERWNSKTHWRLTKAKAFTKDTFFNQERKLGDRRRSDTVVVPTVNYTIPGLGGKFNLAPRVLFDVRFCERRLKALSWQTLNPDPPGTHEKSLRLQVPGGVWSQDWNLKELTEVHTRSGFCGLIWLNTGKLTGTGHREDWQTEALSWFYGGWCMAVLSWWSDLSGQFR